jgi:hypothetical protein
MEAFSVMAAAANFAFANRSARTGAEAADPQLASGWHLRERVRNTDEPLGQQGDVEA